MIRLTGAFICTIILIGSAQAADRFFCVGDQASGFVLENGKWRTATFNTKDDKYVVERIPPFQGLGGETLTWAVKRMGQSSDVFQCRESGEDRIICGGLGYGFVFNPKTLRYLEFYGLGYVDGDAPNNTPAITLGTCTPLS